MLAYRPAGRLLAIGGVMLVDDSTTPDVCKVLRYLRRNGTSWLRPVSLSAYHPEGSTLKYQLGSVLNRVQLSAFMRTAESP